MTTSSRLLSTLALAATATLTAQAQQQLIPAQSELSFVSKQMGVPVEGKFKTFAAQVAFDPAKLATSNIAFTVDTGSASISREADGELPKPVWFNVAQFPKATFQSTSIKRVDATRFDVTGKLSIKGLTSDVVVPVTLAQAGATTTATGAFPIKRLSFRIGEKEWTDTSMVADEVQVKFRLALSGVPKL